MVAYIICDNFITSSGRASKIFPFFKSGYFLYKNSSHRVATSGNLLKNFKNNSMVSINLYTIAALKKRENLTCPARRCN